MADPSSARGNAKPATAPDGVTAVVLTHMRPSLAGDVVRNLVGPEGLPGDRVIVVVNGAGGLDDPELESSVRMVRLPENLGPAGGFLAGMTEAFADPATRWAYLCEDDICLIPLPLPRVADLLERIEAREAGGTRRVGAVVAFGRDFVGRGSHAVNVLPPPGTPQDLAPTDMGSWGATVLSREVFDAGVRPDTTWYFGLEDFDFYCRVRDAGYEVLVDGVAARSVLDQQTDAGRDAALGVRRPLDADEPWRAYYHARNSFELARRHGDVKWHLWHLTFSIRRLQRAGSNAERTAIVHGLWDGMRGRLGENPRYRRRVGELPATAEASAAPEDAAPAR